MSEYMSHTIEHPGTFIREEIEERGWSQRDLAYILGRPEQAINMILSGKRGISAEMAKALGEAFDVPSEFFLNLQRMYDLSCAREPDPGIAKRARFFQSSFPVREMVKRGWLEDTDPVLLETQMMRFFQVDNITDIPHIAHAARKTAQYYDSLPPDQLAWLFRVRQIAQSIEVPKYSEKRLLDAIPALKALMVAPEEVRHVPRILMECGIRYIIVETLPKAKIDGVCFWLNRQKPVIGMSVRFDRIDNYWFVLRHEIEHILKKHGQQNEIIDTELLEKLDRISEEEALANTAATNFCVPSDRMESFIARKPPYISERDLIGFANNLKMHPGIVVGQIHNKTRDYKYFRKHLVKIRKHLFPSALVDGWGDIAPVSL